MAKIIMLKPLFALAILSFFTLVNNSNAEDLPIISGVGGNFTAIDTDGNEVEFSSFKQKVVLLSFGYTNCADICPFTLGYLKSIYDELSSEERKQVRVLFSTVDPEYDTPEHLKEFLAYFNKDFIGLTGTQEQVDSIAALYHAEYRAISARDSIETKHVRRINEKKVGPGKTDRTTLFNHSIMIYLIDKQGNTRSIDYTGTPGEQFIVKIRQLINEHSSVLR